MSQLTETSDVGNARNYKMESANKKRCCNEGRVKRYAIKCAELCVIN